MEKEEQVHQDLSQGSEKNIHRNLDDSKESRKYEEIQQAISAEGRDARNVISWRVPNETPPSPTLRKSIRQKRAVRDKKSRERIPDEELNKTEVHSEISWESSRRDCDVQEQTVLFPHSLWEYLYRNVNRAVDELYYLCEADGNIDHCKWAAETLASCSRDFTKLIERFETQKKFEADHEAFEKSESIPTSVDHDGSLKTKPPSGVAWEVRKSNPLKSGAQDHNSVISNAIEHMERQSTEPAKDEKIASESSCTQSEKNTQLAFGTFTVDLEGNEAVNPKQTLFGGKVLTVEIPKSPYRQGEQACLSSSSRIIPQNEDVAKFSTPKNDSEPNTNLRSGGCESLHQHGDEDFHGEVTNDVYETPYSPGLASEFALDYSDTGQLDGEAQTAALERELEYASDMVWRAAEDWVEAEAKAEEEAWAQLAQEDFTKNSDAAQGKQELPRSAFASPGIDLDGDSFETKDKTVECDVVQISDEDVIYHTSDTEGADFDSSGQFLRRPSSFKAYSDSSIHSAGSFTSRTRKLHQKLSSPQRLKRRTSTEVRERAVQKQEDAEANRDKLYRERQRRLNRQHQKVVSAEQRQRQRRTTMDQQFRERLAAVSQRRESWLARVAGRAINQNSKVEEVVFINELTSDALNSTLQDRLKEVEDRITSARGRRQEHLTNIKQRQRKRAKEKALQMNERELEGEKEAAARWSKLQSRLKAVAARREARLKEAARRMEEAEAAQKLVLERREQQEKEMIERANQKEKRRQEAHERRELELCQKSPSHALCHESETQEAFPAPESDGTTGTLRSGSSTNSSRKNKKNKYRRRKTRGAGKRQGDKLEASIMKDSNPLSTLKSKIASSKKAGATESSQATGAIAKDALETAATSNKKSLKKKVRKLRQKLMDGSGAARWLGEEQESPKLSVPHCPDAIKAKLKWCIGELRRRMLPPVEEKEDEQQSNSQGANTKAKPTTPAEFNQALNYLKKTLDQPQSKAGEVYHFCEEGGVEQCLLLLQPKTAWFPTPDQVQKILLVLRAAMSSPRCRDRALAKTGGVPLVDLLLVALATRLDSTGREKDSYLLAALSCMSILMRHKPLDSLITVQHTLVRYMVACGLFDTMTKILNVFAVASKKTFSSEADLQFLGRIISLLEAILNSTLSNVPPAPIKSTKELTAGLIGHPVASALLSLYLEGGILEATQTLMTTLVITHWTLVGVPSGPDPNVELSEDLVSLCTVSIRCLNHACRINLNGMQSLLSSDALQLQFHSFSDKLLESVTKQLAQSNVGKMLQGPTAEAEGCIQELLILLGYFALNHQANQERLQWGFPPTILMRLCKLPFRYFCDEQYKDVLFPTLLSICYPNCRNQEVLSKEMNSALLSSYIRSKLIEYYKVESRKMKIAAEEDMGISSSELNDQASMVALSSRIPIDLWQDMAVFFT